MISFGAGGGNRTRMGLRPEDFESSASTSFTTPARLTVLCEPLEIVKNFESGKTPVYFRPEAGSEKSAPASANTAASSAGPTAP